MSRGHKERTPAQLAILAQAREKAKIVIAERAKLNAQAKKDETGPVSEEEPPPLRPHPPPEPEPEDEEPRLTRPKYHYIHSVGYIKIK